MMTAIKWFFLAILVCLPSLALPQSQGGLQNGASMDPGNSYVLFIHAGPRKKNDPVVTRLAVQLLQRGYLVREPEEDQDVVGGPGVDYFAPQAAERANDVAKFVNDYLAQGGAPPSAGKMLKPRLQSVKNPATYLGVWLY
jgi:hypothetical protein